MLDHADTYSSAFSKANYQRLLDGKVKEEDMWKYSSFWYKNFDEMAKKTMLRQLISKWGIMSTDMQKAYEADMAVQKDDGTYDYIDNQIQDIDVIVEQNDDNAHEAEIKEEETTKTSTAKQVNINEI